MLSNIVSTETTRALDCAAKLGLATFPIEADLFSGRPYSGTVDDFLRLGASLGARVLYTSIEAIDDNDLEHWGHRLQDCGADSVPLLKELRERTGDAISSAFGWRLDQVDHLVLLEAQWWANWEAKAEELIDMQQSRDHEERLNDTARRLERAAITLAADAEFRMAPRTQRVSACTALFPDLPTQVRQQLVREASQLMDAELQPQACDLFRQGMKPKEIAVALGIAGSTASRYVARSADAA